MALIVIKLMAHPECFASI